MNAALPAEEVKAIADDYACRFILVKSVQEAHEFITAAISEALSRARSVTEGEMTIEQSICEEITARREKGLAKYGVGVERTDLTVPEWLQHAKEEGMDLIIYLERIKRELSSRIPSGELGELLKEVEIHCKFATEEPWVIEDQGEGLEVGHKFRGHLYNSITRNLSEEDASFIAFARTALPRLARELADALAGLGEKDKGI